MIEGVNTAGAAEQMAGNASVKAVAGEVFCSLEEFKILRCNDVVQESLFGTDRAITQNCLPFSQSYSKTNSAAMAPPLLVDHLLLSH